MNAALAVLGAGCNGVDELQSCLNDASVQWALLRFQLGSGAFSRSKILFLHLNGADCPAIRRGQANEYTSLAQQILRSDCMDSFHASLEVTRKDEVTAEQLWARVGHFFISDDLGDYSAQLTMQDIKHQVSRSQRAAALSTEAAEPASCLVPAQLPVPPFAGRAALRAVAEPYGSWNWVLVRPDPADPAELAVVGGGSGSIDEMKECLAGHKDDVLSGFVRLGFGSGRLRRTKHVFVHAIGEHVPVVTRGRLAAARPLMERAISALAHCSAALEVSHLDDLTPEAVIDRLRRAAVLDDVVLGGDSQPRKAISLEAFREALDEERAAPRLPEASQGPCGARWSERLVEDVVRLLHAPGGPLNWALFGLNLARLRTATMPSLLTAPRPLQPHQRHQHQSHHLPWAATCKGTTVVPGGLRQQLAAPGH